MNPAPRTAGWAWPPFAVMALAQIAIPLVDDDTAIEWLSTVVVVAFAASTLVLTVAHWGPRWAALAGGYVAVVTLAIEEVGSSSGFPFGEYHYTGALQPTIGDVPVIVPLAWLAMGIPALEVGGSIVRSRLGRVVVGAAALTAWDLFLDPQMVDNGYWDWAVDGAYHGIPLSNYAGWFGVSILVLGIVDRIRPHDRPPGIGLIGLYTWWAVMNTIGFVVFFGEPVVGLVGGIGMGSVTLLAWSRLRSGHEVEIGTARG